MKLTSAQIQQAVPQIGAQAIPEDHPVVSQLKGLFGDHTFFVGQDGLNIVETVESTDSSRQAASVVNVARWADPERTALMPHEPEVTDVVVEIGPDYPESAA